MGIFSDAAEQGAGTLSGRCPHNTITDAAWADIGLFPQRLKEAQEAKAKGHNARFTRSLRDLGETAAKIERQMLADFEQLHSSLLVHKLLHYAAGVLTDLNLESLDLKADFANAHAIKMRAIGDFVKRFTDAFETLVDADGEGAFEAYTALATQRLQTDAPQEKSPPLSRDKILDIIADAFAKVEPLPTKDGRLQNLLDHQCHTDPACPSCDLMKAWARGEITFGFFVRHVMEEFGEDLVERRKSLSWLGDFSSAHFGLLDCTTENLDAGLQSFGFRAWTLKVDGKDYLVIGTEQEWQEAHTPSDPARPDGEDSGNLDPVAEIAIAVFGEHITRDADDNVLVQGDAVERLDALSKKWENEEARAND